MGPDDDVERGTLTRLPPDRQRPREGSDPSDKGTEETFTTDSKQGAAVPRIVIDDVDDDRQGYEADNEFGEKEGKN
jgi:hypothetical protein